MTSRCHFAQDYLHFPKICKHCETGRVIFIPRFYFGQMVLACILPVSSFTPVMEKYIMIKKPVKNYEQNKMLSHIGSKTK